RDLLEIRPLGERLHALGDGDGFLPVLLLLEDLQQEAQRLQLERGAVELAEQLFGTIEQPGAMEILRQLEHRGLPLIVGKVGAVEQVLVHADRAIDLALSAEEIAQREVKVDRLRVDLDDLDEGLDRLVGLLVQEEIQPAEIRQRQRARLAKQVRDIDARRDPPQREEQHRDRQQPPQTLEVHHASVTRRRMGPPTAGSTRAGARGARGAAARAVASAARSA